MIIKKRYPLSILSHPRVVNLACLKQRFNGCLFQVSFYCLFQISLFAIYFIKVYT